MLATGAPLALPWTLKELNVAFPFSYIAPQSFFRFFFFSWAPIHYIAPTYAQRQMAYITLLWILLIWSVFYMIKCRAVFNRILAHFPLLSLLIAYVLLRFIMSAFAMPPDTRYVPGLVLSAIYFTLGLIVARHTSMVSTFVSVYGYILCAVGIFKLFSGQLQLYSATFQSILPIPTLEEQSNAYQAESFFLALTIVWFGSLLFFSSCKVIKAFIVIVMFSAIVLMAISAGRSAFVAMVVALAYLLWVRRPSVAVVVLTLTAVIAIGLINWDVTNVSGFLLFGRLTILSDIEADPSYRIRLLSSALELWLSNATVFLVGLGAGGFQKMLGLWDPGWYPHNIILEIAVEYGIFGLLLFGSVLYRAMVSLARVNESEDWRSVALKGQFVVVVIVYMFSGGVQTMWPMLFIAGVLSGASFEREKTSRAYRGLPKEGTA